MINIRHIHSFNRVCVCCIEHSSVWVFVCALVVSMCIWKRPRFTNENDEWTEKAHDKYVEELPTTAQQKQHTHTQRQCVWVFGVQRKYSDLVSHSLTCLLHTVEVNQLNFSYLSSLFLTLSLSFSLSRAGSYPSIQSKNIHTNTLQHLNCDCS